MNVFAGILSHESTHPSPGDAESAMTCTSLHCGRNLENLRSHWRNEPPGQGTQPAKHSCCDATALTAAPPRLPLISFFIMPFSSISFYLFEILFLPTELRPNEPRLVTEPPRLTSACLLSVISSRMQANFVKLNWKIRDDHNWSPNPPTKTATATAPAAVPGSPPLTR